MTFAIVSVHITILPNPFTAIIGVGPPIMESVTPKMESMPPIMESDWVRQNNKCRNLEARHMPRIKEFDKIHLCEIEIAIFQQKILKTLFFVI